MFLNTTLVVSVMLTLAATASHGANLILNGTFEGGSISNWTPVSQAFPNTSGSCNLSFASQSTASGCQTGINPVSGSYAAYASTSFPVIANSTGEWINYLNQDFVVPLSVSSGILTWSDSAVWNGSGTFRGVDVLVQLYNGGTFLSNQYSVQNPGSSGQELWTTHSWDVTSILQANPNATLTLKLTALAFYDTRSGPGSSATTLNAGFDDVALNVASSTPEPATIGLTGAALLCLGLIRRRHRGNKL